MQDLLLLRRIRRRLGAFRGERQRMPQRPLRRPRLGGQPGNLRRRLRIAQFLRPLGQDIAQHRPPLGRYRIGGLARPGHSPHVVWLTLRRRARGIVEQFRRGSLARRSPQAPQQQRRQQCLRRRMVQPRRAFQPAHALSGAARHAHPVQIGPAHAHAGFRLPPRRGTRQQPHRGDRITRRQQPVGALHQHARRRKARQPDAERHA